MKFISRFKRKKGKVILSFALELTTEEQKGILDISRKDDRCFENMDLAKIYKETDLYAKLGLLRVLCFWAEIWRDKDKHSWVKQYPKPRKNK